MLQSLKRLTKHSAVYGIGHIVTRLVNFLLLPLYTNKLPADEFAVSANLFAFLAVMTPIYTYGIDAAFLRYFILSDDERKRRRIFSTAFWSVFVVACGLTLFFYNFGELWSTLLLRSSSRGNLVQLAGLILLFDALAFLPFLYLRAEEKSTFFVIVKFVNVIINVGLNIFFIVNLAKGVEGIFLANLWASVATFLMLAGILLKQISWQFSSVDFKELLRFGLPFLPAVLFVVMLDALDRIILTRLAGLEVTGLYHAGFKLGMFMALFVTAFRFAWHPFFLSTSKQEDARLIFSKILTYFTATGACIFLAISFFIEEIVQIQVFGYNLIGREYWAGTRVVPLIMVAYLVYGIYVNLVVGIYLKKKTRYLPLITGAGVLINIVANLLLIPILGMMGAAVAKIAGYVVMCVSLYIFAQRLYTIPYEFVRLTKLAAVVLVVFYLGTVVSGAGEHLLKIALVLGFPVFLFLTGFFERRELQTLKVLLTSKLLRIRG